MCVCVCVCVTEDFTSDEQPIPVMRVYVVCNIHTHMSRNVYECFKGITNQIDDSLLWPDLFCKVLIQLWWLFQS